MSGEVSNLDLYEFDPIIWYAEREVPFCPRHFIKASTPITEEAKQWVMDKLRGRYYIDRDFAAFISIGISLDIVGYIYFEDSKEAMMYELRWT